MRQYDRKQLDNLKRTDCEEVGKHRKSKESNVSKSNKKSNHKHSYAEAIIVSKTYGNKDHASVGEYCTICGKLKITHYFITVPCKSGGHLVVDNDKVIEMYGHLPKFRVDDVFQDFIDIEKDRIE